MDVNQKLKIALPDNDKLHVLCDMDTPLGMIYDFICAFKTYISGKIQEAEAASAPPAAPVVPADAPVEAPAEPVVSPVAEA